MKKHLYNLIKGETLEEKERNLTISEDFANTKFVEYQMRKER